MGTLSNFNIVQDDEGDISIDVLAPAKYIDTRVLVAGTAQTHTFPTNARYAIFNSTANFFARWDGSAAAVPSANITDGSGAELNPVARRINGGQTVSLISPSAATITIATFS
jgi:hypothetical protein